MIADFQTKSVFGSMSDEADERQCKSDIYVKHLIHPLLRYISCSVKVNGRDETNFSYALEFVLATMKARTGTEKKTVTMPDSCLS
jgi:hypothetical protein